MISTAALALPSHNWVSHEIAIYLKKAHEVSPISGCRAKDSEQSTHATLGAERCNCTWVFEVYLAIHPATCSAPCTAVGIFVSKYFPLAASATATVIKVDRIINYLGTCSC
jgi:hypothetical protein